MYSAWHLVEIEHVDQPRARLLRVVARTDDLDHLVDVQDRDEQTLDQVQPLLPAREPVLRAPGHHGEAVVEVDLQQLAQAERLRGPPPTSATLLIEKFSSSGVSR